MGLQGLFEGEIYLFRKYKEVGFQNYNDKVCVMEKYMANRKCDLLLN